MVTAVCLFLLLGNRPLNPGVTTVITAAVVTVVYLLFPLLGNGPLYSGAAAVVTVVCLLFPLL